MSTESNIELSAADLILNLLEGHDRHRLSVQSLTRGAELFRIREQAVRVALTRLIGQGKITSPSRGQYELNVVGSTLLGDIENWLRMEERAVPWNGQWLGVSDAAVPRRQKVAWRRHLKALALRGFELLQEGFWVRPDNIKGSATGLRADLQSLGLAHGALVMSLTALDESNELRARSLWDSQALEHQYRAMLEALRDSRRQLEKAPLESAARESLLLGRAAIRLILHDPLLPDELMAGNRRRELIAAMREYQRWAKSVWMEFLGE
ncbi:PaaX family transcriptional regulator C-terminal domain-containing protein [Microbulbifer magnicolonia]|uniref:PaaX family transcriptional regulator C-terminal domain-containing protein n=1 Tax=Microbulbifer magnicolonia TaxID=3109744 RepID=UPI002B40D3C2|nr:PaaX family transcriptional regulator C-terminal domain-containing protein [Microbulbifer sp. GG15]